jgi:hypothetical protein
MIPTLLLALAQQRAHGGCVELFPPHAPPPVLDRHVRRVPRVCRVAVETDWQLYQKLGAGTDEYVLDLVAAASEQLRRDVGVTIELAYLGIHSSSSDGWATQETPGGTAEDLLYEFQAAWGTHWPAPADAAHFLSGDQLGGGVAYVGTLCDRAFGFAVSGNITGSINWGTWDGRPRSNAWDYYVFAHELGHNLGSRHTHEFCPPLDRCATAWCNPVQLCTRGTLMSYCHQCAGTMANIDLEYHPACAAAMRQRLGCLPIRGPR